MTRQDAQRNQNAQASHAKARRLGAGQYAGCTARAAALDSAKRIQIIAMVYALMKP